MTKFFIQKCGGDFRMVNDFVEDWLRLHPECKLVHVDWHCYESSWYAGITYEEGKLEV